MMIDEDDEGPLGPLEKQVLLDLQTMTVSNEISGMQEQNIVGASVQLLLSVHSKCAYKILSLYL